ncbi:hypothetical protein D3C71_2000740 [compost metagenome]
MNLYDVLFAPERLQDERSLIWNIPCPVTQFRAFLTPRRRNLETADRPAEHIIIDNPITDPDRDQQPGALRQVKVEDKVNDPRRIRESMMDAK